MSRAAGALVAVLLVSACATTPAGSGSASESGAPAPQASAAPSGTVAPQPTRSATPLASAISATSAPGTARVEVRILTSVGGLEDELTGTGITVFGTGDADMAWQAGAGASREVTADGAAWLQLDPPTGEWLAVPDGTWIPTIDAGRPLRGLTDLRDVRVDGTERLGGIETTRLVGSLPATGNLGGLGINELAARAVQDDPEARVDVTIWVDGTGRIVRITRTIASTTDVQASATTELSDFGIAAQIRDPQEQ